MKENWKSILIICLVAVLILQQNCNSREIELHKNLNKSMKDSIKHSTNSKGEKVASISINQINSLKQLNDNLRKELQRVSKLKTATEIKTVTKTEYKFITDLRVDTTRLDSLPTYSTKWKNKWSEGFIIANPDTVEFKSIQYNDFLVTTQGKRGVFKVKPATINVTNRNPNTKTTKIESYQFIPKQKIISIGIQAGYGLTPKGIQPYAGLGIQINIK